MIPVTGGLPGTIVIPAPEFSRITAFTMSLTSMLVPQKSQISWGIGMNVATNVNGGIREMLARPQDQWVWIMGDDHTFEPEILLRLLDRDVPAVVPICATRKPPFHGVAYERLHDNPAGKWRPIPWDDYPAGGLMRVDAAGTAGMLLRRSVLETIPSPWMELARVESDSMSEDLWFCEKLRLAGIPLSVDTDQSIGHVALCTLWPRREKGQIRTSLEFQYVPIGRL